MTANNDRRHRVQLHSVSAVEHAINDSVFGEDNREIMRDLFLRNLTYDATASRANISVRGLQKRVKTQFNAF